MNGFLKYLLVFICVSVTALCSGCLQRDKQLHEPVAADSDASESENSADVHYEADDDDNDNDDDDYYDDDDDIADDDDYYADDDYYDYDDYYDDYLCHIPNAIYEVIDGECIAKKCIENYHDANALFKDGCEYYCVISNNGAEICDGFDNDCNGLVDDMPDVKTNPEHCNGCEVQCPFGENSIALCNDWQCSLECVPGCYDIDKTPENGCEYCCEITNGGVEICDGVDNDCDAMVDEDEFGATLCEKCDENCETGWRCCESGQWSECSLEKPMYELCNGIDDNCNGLTDEAHEGNSNMLVLECSTVCEMGYMFCESGLWSECSALEPTPEVSDGLDNDCDGLVDDNLPFYVGLCDTGLMGPCSLGVLIDSSGMSACLPLNEPEYEICDGIDNDCNGLIDDDQFGVGGICYLGVEEICDGIDNNHNEEIDEGELCPAGQQCIAGECLRVCPSGECPPGYICEDIKGSSLCISACKDVDCPEGFICDPETVECVDPCDGAVCASDEKCLLGKCVNGNCLESGCLESERCRADGHCEPDPCVDAGCDANQGCRDGECFDSCSYASCESPYNCPDKECFDNDCTRVLCMFNTARVWSDSECDYEKCNIVQCKIGEACIDDTCVKNPCSEITCDNGYVCDNTGVCIENPCLRTRCPAGERCRRGQCVLDIW